MTQTCSHCGAVITGNTRFCSECGYEMQPAQQSAKRPAQVIDSQPTPGQSPLRFNQAALGNMLSQAPLVMGGLNQMRRKSRTASPMQWVMGVLAILVAIVVVVLVGKFVWWLVTTVLLPLAVVALIAYLIWRFVLGGRRVRMRRRF